MNGWSDDDKGLADDGWGDYKDFAYDDMMVEVMMIKLSLIMVGWLKWWW